MCKCPSKKTTKIWGIGFLLITTLPNIPRRCLLAAACGNGPFPLVVILGHCREKCVPKFQPIYTIRLCLQWLGMSCLIMLIWLYHYAYTDCASHYFLCQYRICVFDGLDGFTTGYFNCHSALCHICGHFPLPQKSVIDITSFFFVFQEQPKQYLKGLFSEQ